MCGIIGIIGDLSYLKKGLELLEYRGYDSCGIAYYDKKMNLLKDIGEVKKVIRITPKGIAGIGHTRWATHGAVKKQNAHPFLYKGIALVHNGIIDNYKELKNKYKGKYESETDSEVILHVLAAKGFSLKGLKETIKELKGSYAIVAQKDDKIIFAKKGMSLYLAKGKKAIGIASDIRALEFADKFYVIKDNQYGIITKEKIEVYEGNKKITIKWNKKLNFEKQTKKEKYFMLKEIKEGEKLLDYRVEGSRILKQIKNKEITLIGSGTSYHAALFGKYMLRDLNIDSQAVVASEYKSSIYKNKIIIAFSQSGETADTIKAIKQAKEQGAKKIIAIVNNIYSTIASLADIVIDMKAGQEIAVAATKTFNAQTAIMLGIKGKKAKIKKKIRIKKIVKEILNSNKIFFIGKDSYYPLALEGALKLKEITYKQAEGMPAGELKHGTLSLIDKEAIIIGIGKDIEKSIEECKARGGKTFIIDGSYHEIINALQRIAYETAIALKRNPDKPRNLAKSVTVE